MAARKLRHDKAWIGAAGTPVNAIGALVPTARAYVIAKVSIASTVALGGSNITVSLRVGATATTGGTRVAHNVVLTPGQAYNETNLVAVVGEGVWVTADNLECDINVFGEEVDN